MQTTKPDTDILKRRTDDKDRATRNRSAWPVAMHAEKGELKVDRKVD